MPTWCIVRGCKNTSRRKGDCDLSWHSFPNHDEKLMTEWLIRVNRIEQVQGQANKHWKICSEHFEPYLIEKTLTGRKRLKKGAVPTIFDQKDIKRRRLNVEEHRQKLMAVEVAFMNGEKINLDSIEQHKVPLNEVCDHPDEEEKLNGLKRVLKELKQAKKSHEALSFDNETQPSDQCSITPTNNASPPSLPLLTEKEYYEAVIKSLKLENEQLKNKISSENQMKLEIEKQRDSVTAENAALRKGLSDEIQLRKDAENRLNVECKAREKLERELETVSFNFQGLSQNPKYFHYYSGFNVNEFESFIDFLGRNTCDHLSYDDRGKSMYQEGVDVSQQRMPPGRKRSLSPKDQLLMSLCRIRQGLTCQDLGVRFQMSMPQVSRITGSFIQLIKKRLEEEGLWPEEEKTHIHNNQWPEVLKPFHQRVRAMIVSLKTHLKNNAKYQQHLSMATNMTYQGKDYNSENNDRLNHNVSNTDTAAHNESTRHQRKNTVDQSMNTTLSCI